jgi:hypothetical protein
LVEPLAQTKPKINNPLTVRAFISNAPAVHKPSVYKEKQTKPNDKTVKCFFNYNKKLYIIYYNNRVYNINFGYYNIFVCKLRKNFKLGERFETRNGTIFSHVSDYIYRYDMLFVVI